MGSYDNMGNLIEAITTAFKKIALHFFLLRTKFVEHSTEVRSAVTFLLRIYITTLSSTAKMNHDSGLTRLCTFPVGSSRLRGTMQIVGVAAQIWLSMLFS